jgi:hypothetical protein
MQNFPVKKWATKAYKLVLQGKIEEASKIFKENGRDPKEETRWIQEFIEKEKHGTHKRVLGLRVHR